MPEYVRGTGAHAAERVRPVPGSSEAERYAALAADPGSGWREAAPTPAGPPSGGRVGGGPDASGRPARSAPKADWLAYADSVDGADHSALTKDQLIAQFGGDS